MADQFDVVVIGAGPVGLCTAVQCGRFGLRCIVLERRETLSRHPKASGLHARTMEILRQWGVADSIRAANPLNRTLSVRWVTRLAGIEIGAMDLGASSEERELIEALTPEPGAYIGQDLVEPILARVAQSYIGVELRSGCEVIDLAEESEGVAVSYLNSQQLRMIVRAKYVVAADGPRGFTRCLLGIGEHGHRSLAEGVDVRFTADIREYMKGLEAGLFWVRNADTQGAFLFTPGSDMRYNFEVENGVDPESYTLERCAELVHRAIGTDIPLKIVSIQRWQRDQAVTDQWRRGRIFFAGDAAHRFPPHGGFGMNSGVQDSHNLVWKIIAVLRWNAGDKLLDSYEAERLLVAELNGAQCLYNTRQMEKTGFKLNDPESLSSIETEEGAGLRKMIADGIPFQRDHFYSYGQQFGQLYDSTAIVPDQTEPVLSTVPEYRSNARPGARAPHQWVHRAGHRISTFDLYNGGFTLLTGRDNAKWTAMVEMINANAGPPIKAHGFGADLGMDDDAAYHAALKLYGIGPSGAVLVRPDGYVGYRQAQAPDHPLDSLVGALAQILDVPREISARWKSSRNSTRS
jgi:putative polyketide hydroxylase